MSDILIYTLIIVIVAFPIGFIWFYMSWKKKDMLEDINNLSCMSVSVPKEVQRNQNEENRPIKNFQDLIAPNEQMLSALTTIIHHRNIFNWFFNTPTHVSFELISLNGAITLYVICPKKIQSVVERQIHSYFPEAEIILTTPPKIFSEEFPAIEGAVFEQAKSFVLPIKTYRHLEADPFSGISTALTKLHNGAGGAIQILIRPTSERWTMHTHIASTHVSNNQSYLVTSSKTSRVFNLWREFVKPSKNNPETTPNAYNETLSKAIQEKGSKTGFEVVIRVVTTGKDEALAKENLKTIIAAFSQYYAPDLNSFKYRHIKAGKIARDYLLRLFINAPKMILNTEELSSIIHIPNRFVETPGLKWLVARTLPPPPNLPEEGIVFGKTSHRGIEKMVRITDEDRARHVFMIGKTGVGKTTLFELMAEQDMHNGKGLCFIDPNGDAFESLLKKVPTSRAKDVIIFDPSDTKYPMGLNLLEWHKTEEKDFLIQEVIEIFYKLFDPNRTGIVGPQWEHWGRNAALTVMSLPGGGSLIDLPRLFTDENFQKYARSFVTDPVVKSFWEEQLTKTADFHKSEMYNYFISKFGRFTTNELMRNIIGQAESSFNLREIMDEGKILLINLAKGKIGEINSNLLGLILVSKIQVAAFSRADMPEEDRKPFYLYVDEFQNFTTDSFATILAEARKFRLNLNITNQYLAQLTEKIRDAVIGNAGTIISYRVGAEDAEYLIKEMPGLGIEDLTNLDRYEAYVKELVEQAPTKPFSIKGIKSPSKGSPEMAEWIRQANRHLYSKPPVEYKVMNAVPGVGASSEKR